MPRSVHAIHFPKPRWTLERAERWLLKHAYTPIKDVDNTKHFYRYRILPRSKKYNYFTKVLPNGIHMVIRLNK
jgi:hypothetical protein